MAQMSRGNRPSLRSISSYILLTLFLTVFLFLGLLNQSTYFGKKHPKYDFPDFDRISTHTSVLSERDVNLNDTSSRMIVIGDVHGMNESLHDLLKRVSYDPSHDNLFFAGDLLAKSSHASSLSVIDFLTKNHNITGTEHIYPVRGNHDQIVVQWRAWREWFEGLTLTAPSASSSAPFFFRIRSDLVSVFSSMFQVNPFMSEGAAHTSQKSQVPPISTGREFLQLIEAEWALEKAGNEPDPEEYVDAARKRAIGTWREVWWTRIPPPGKGRNYQSWNLFTDHYWLARDMTPAQAAYLTSLPLVRHIPHLHIFVAHAGILPSDPRLSPTDPRQPLAHPPHEKPPHHPIGYDPDADTDNDGDKDDAFVSRLRSNMLALQDQEASIGSSVTLLGERDGRVSVLQDTPDEVLRELQETALLQEVPQNRDPWVILNMRSIKKKGKVTRNGDKGTPWSEVWNEQMSRCDGFEDLSSSAAEDNVSSTRDLDAVKKKPKYSLSCHPSTVVYGHAASRGLDIKRWSMGLDTGCLYGRKLTALVLRGPKSAQEDHGDEDEDDEDEEDDDEDEHEHDSDDDEDSDDDDDDGFKSKRIRFGDRKAGIKARLVSVQCPTIEADD